MTSIEWLGYELNTKLFYNISSELWEEVNTIFDKAKEMHKQEIIDAYKVGNNDYANFNYVATSGDDYYYVTFVSKGSDDTFKVWECCGMEECICNGSGMSEKPNNIEPQLPQQEISDEEIEKGAEDWQEFRQGAGKQSFEAGAKWYREQLKQR